MKKTSLTLQKLKTEKKQISILTCYDFPTAKLLDACNIDAVLIGDSVGTNILGYSSEKEVTINDMIHHTKAVSKGIQQASIITDLPYNTYETPEKALNTAQKIKNAGADIIKLEGFKPDIIKTLKNHSIPVMAHLGLTPQTHQKKQVQAKTLTDASELYHQATALESEGASLLILELVPEEVAQLISERLTIPVIGIGAGRYCDGQVQIFQDIIGLSDKQFKHVKTYLNTNELLTQTVTNYINDIQSQSLLTESHAAHMSQTDLDELKSLLSS